MAAKQKKLFVLDTNILMYEPNAIYHFEENDLYLPMVVLEELDMHKTGTSEVARNVRQINRMLVDLISNVSHKEICEGIPIVHANHPMAKICTGRLFLQTDDFDAIVATSLPGHKVDNTILATALGLQKNHTDNQIIIVSKDINLRIKAGILNISAEDYFSDQVITDLDLLHNGLHILENNFWDLHAKNMESWQDSGDTLYKITGPLIKSWNPNDCLSTEDDSFHAIVKSIENNHAIIKMAKDYTKHNVWGIHARNKEQNFAINLLLDPDIDFLTLQGTAGTGKTLLTIAAGLTQVLDTRQYLEIIMTRVTIPVGEDIGFLPGTEEEKMTPWMGALMDNLEVLSSNSAAQESNNLAKIAAEDFLQSKIKIRSLNYMRGRTFLNRFIIIDEAQNLTPKQIKTLVTRAGPGSKIICLGDIKQIDTPYLSENNSGLTFAVDRFKTWQHSAHMTLTRGERSRLAFYAAEHL